LQLIDDQFDQILIIVNNQNLALAAIERVGRNAVVAHERIKLIARNSAEAATRHAEALKLPRVETTDNRLLTDLADFGSFAGCEYGFHVLKPPLSLVDGKTILAQTCLATASRKSSTRYEHPPISRPRTPGTRRTLIRLLFPQFYGRSQSAALT